MQHTASMYATFCTKPREMEVKIKETNTSWDPLRAREKACSTLVTLQPAALVWRATEESLVISCFPECPCGTASQRSANICNAADWETEVMLRDHYWTVVGTESCAILKHTFFCYPVRVHLLQPLTSVINGANQFVGMCGYYFFSWNGAQLTFCENT